MSTAGKKSEQGKPAVVVQEKEGGLLAQVLDQMPKLVEREKGRSLIEALIDQSLKGTVIWGKSVTNTIKQAIDQLDVALSKQLAAIMHAPEFSKLEGTWRGLQYLVSNSETGDMLKLRVLNVSKREVFKDLDSAIEFDQSQLCKKIYDAEYGILGGKPYGALIGDYEFTNHPEDIDLLQKMAGVSAMAFAPFVSAASPHLFGYESFTQLPRDRDLKKVFASKDYIKWKSFRDSEDSRFVCLTMPRTLARLPYGSQTKTIDEFVFEEGELDRKGRLREMRHDHYCWMNTAWVLGARLTDSFARHYWCTAIRGVENGGKVEDLPVHVFQSDDGDMDLKCPTEVGITDTRELELSELGFLPLCHSKDDNFSVFLGGQTCQNPKKYDNDAGTANAKLMTGLQTNMAASRIAHYLKCIARDKIGAFMERKDMEEFLKRWIARYVLVDDKPDAESRAKYPLAQAEITVTEVAGSPGVYNAVAHLRPWLPFEKLTASLRMVAKLPQAKG